MNNKKKIAGHKGFIIKKRPKKYNITNPQEVMRKVVRQCGIKKGISKIELQTAMKNCVGPVMKKYYQEKNN